MKIKSLLSAVILFLVFSSLTFSMPQTSTNTHLTTMKKKLPDLVALSMNVKAKDGGELLAGKEAMIGCSLTNSGASFVGEYRIAIQLDGNPVGLPQGSTATPTTTGFATPWVATAGNHTAKCIVDKQNTIAESNESNNEIYYRFSVKKADPPDLVPTGMKVAVKDGSELAAGKETMVGCDLQNNGGSFTSEFRIGIQMDGSPLGLPQGSTATPATTGFATPWVATAGTHTAKCTVDTQNTVAESNEKNNVFTYNFTVPNSITPAPPGGLQIIKPDITIEKIEVKAEDGTNVTPGKASRIFCHWKRTGAQPSTTFRVLIKMDGTPLTLPQGDTVDETRTTSWLGTPWTAVAGDHQIYCEVDSQHAVEETNEKNNKWVQIYNLPNSPLNPADLTHGGSVRLKTDVMIEKIEVKAEDGGKLFDGKAARIYCYWKRTGPEPMADFRIATYVDDAALGSELGSTVQHDRETGWLGTPWIARAGSHTFKCFADSAFQINESNETNNTRIIGLDIMPGK